MMASKPRFGVLISRHEKQRTYEDPLVGNKKVAFIAY